MDVRIYDVTGQTLARATLVKGADGKVPSIAAVVLLMRKGKVFLSEWEEPKTTTPKNDPDAESRAAAEKAQADRIAAEKASADKRAAAEKAAAEKGGRQGGR
jgi:hypothetical protein